ncbi:MAG: hypothetical protein ABR540_05965, partial [Acidimicrobiales bacterium]
MPDCVRRAEGRFLKEADTLMGTGELMRPPQMSIACWKASAAAVGNPIRIGLKVAVAAVASDVARAVAVSSGGDERVGVSGIGPEDHLG